MLSQGRACFRFAVFLLITAGFGLVMPQEGMAADSFVIQHVTVIDATGGPAKENQMLVVRDGKIVEPGSKPRAPRGAAVIEGKGKYVIPGLWDMHVHFRGGTRLIRDNEIWLPLLLASGVVGVREMGTDIPETVLAWRNEINSGSRFGPRILTAAAKVEMERGMRATPGAIGVSDAESARLAVRKLKQMGADFVKIYSDEYAPGVFESLTTEARNLNLRIGGHLPLNTVTVREAIGMGVSFIEHMEPYVLAGCSEAEMALRRTAPVAPARLPAYVENFDERVASDLAVQLARAKVWVTPTLAATRQMAANPQDFEASPLRQFITAGIWRTWMPVAGRPRPRPEVLEAASGVERTLIPLLQRHGVGLLAGSDSAVSNGFTFPGWTLHRELELLVDFGLTPMQALQAATRNAADWRGELGTSGTIEAGKVADLLLLSADPLKDIRNVASIDAVIVKGKVLMRSELDEMLAKVSAQAASTAKRP